VEEAAAPRGRDRHDIADLLDEAHVRSTNEVNISQNLGQILNWYGRGEWFPQCTIGLLNVKNKILFCVLKRVPSSRKEEKPGKVFTLRPTTPFELEARITQRTDVPILVILH
jgi:hypothetical protein